MDEVYTLEKVFEKLPKLNNVSDIVLLVGINNIKRPNVTIEGTVAQYDQVCKDVQKLYPNATIHVGSVAPSCERFIFYNAELEKTCSTAKCSLYHSLTNSGGDTSWAHAKTELCQRYPLHQKWDKAFCK